MRRRRLLTAAGGLLAALAGCTGATTNRDGGSPTTTAAEPDTTTRPSADDALVVEERSPVEGTMVNLGAGGTARNAASTALVDCVVEATGSVGGTSYTVRAARDRLEPGATWEWEVAFGPEADAMDVDSVEGLTVETWAAYAGERAFGPARASKPLTTRTK